MRWINPLSSSDAAVAANGRELTIIAGAAHSGMSRNDVAMPGTFKEPDPPLSDEIKRRQVALIQRYIAALRAR